MACSAALLGALVAGHARAADADREPPLLSEMDFTHPGARDVPIRCRPGDVEYYPERTMADVFGDALPEPPASTIAKRARVVRAMPPVWPRGLGQNGATAVVAILVGADGRVIDAHAVCASVPAIAKPAVRASLRSEYEPATFDGTPAVSVVIYRHRFHVRDAASTPVPDRPGGR